MNYQTFKENNYKPLNKFISKNVFFAFSDKQFEEGLKKMGLTHDDLNKLSKYYGGGFILKSSIKEHDKIAKQCHKAERKYLSKFKNLVSALEYEMHNHECGYTGRYSEGLNALGYSLEDLQKNKKLLRAYRIARHKVYTWFIENN